VPFGSPDSLSQSFHGVGSSLSDTVRSTSAEHHGEFDFAHLLDHLKDSRAIELPFGHIELPALPPIQIGEWTIDVSPTKHVVFLFVAAIVMAIMTIRAARKNTRERVPAGIGNLIEVYVVFVRDEIVLKTMGRGGLPYLPYLLTTLLFILILNLLGLMPYGATATGNLSVTATLALVAFVMIQVAAIRAQGIAHYLAHLTGGVSWWLWPIMIPIEILGLLTKPFALAMRLFANMTGGHIVILALLGFIFIARSYLLAPVPVLFVVAINLLEILVALIQAYIFTMLTALFMGLGIPRDGHAAHPHKSDA